MPDWWIDDSIPVGPTLPDPIRYIISPIPQGYEWPAAGFKLTVKDTNGVKISLGTVLEVEHVKDFFGRTPASLVITYQPEE